MPPPLEAPDHPETNAPTPAKLQETGWRPLRLGEWRLLALIVLLFMLRDVPWRLEEFGQAPQAFASLEMVQGGHWWFQHLPGERLVSISPPLAGWISACLYYLTAGDWDLAWRLPSLLSALALVALLWRAGECFWPLWGGTLAVGAFALNFLTPRLAMLASVEMPLALEVTLLGLVVWERVRTSRPWSARTRWAVFCLLFAALMTDGPVVYGLLLPGLIVHRWISRRRSLQPVADVWGGWWHWTLPLLVYIFWLERGAVTMPGFYQELVGHSAARRLAANQADAYQPLYFYVLELLVRWAPWSLLLLAMRLRARRVWWRVCAEPAALWLVCWAAGGLLCLSLIPGKRLDRILPILPPLCLLLTAALAAARIPAIGTPGTPAPEEALWPQTWSRWTLWTACAIALISTVAGVGGVYSRHENVRSEFGEQVLSQTAPGRCEMVLTKEPAPDEQALLVYLRRLTYIDPAQAIQLNSTGRLDYIVVGARTLAGSRGLLARFNSAHPALVSRDGAQFVLLSAATPPAANPDANR